MARTKAEIAETGPKDPSEVDVSDIATDAPESVELANCIDNAGRALDEKSEVLSRIQSARMLSTLLIQNGSGSREQVAWVRFYLPRKTRKSNGAEEETE